MFILLFLTKGLNPNVKRAGSAKIIRLIYKLNTRTCNLTRMMYFAITRRVYNNALVPDIMELTLTLSLITLIYVP